MIFSITLFIVLLAFVVVYEFFSLIINRYLWNKFSILKDIHLLSKARSTKVPGVAIVCGGSIAGLFAAKVCANHFEKVVIVEPEEWVAIQSDKGLDSGPRKTNTLKRARVAQYTAFHHYHLLVTSVMREMFGSQNLDKAVRSVGGRLATYRPVLWLSGSPMFPPSGLSHASADGSVVPPVMSLTRPTFETLLRRLVLRACKEVQYFHGTVTGLIHEENNNKISGVNIKLPNGDRVGLQGNIVIDATGPFMGGFRWLKDIPALSSQRPSLDNLKITYNPNASQTTCEFTLPPDLEEDLRKYGFPTDQDNNGFLYGFLPGREPDNTVLYIEKREKNLLHIACGGYGWSDKIRSVRDIEEFMKNMNWKKPKPQWIEELLQTLRQQNVPVSFSHFKYGGSVYIKYHEAKNYLPSNFIAVGDAQSQTNPALGQGCSKACAHAIILNSQLHRSIENSSGVLSRDFSKKYFLEVKDRTEHIWLNLKNIDYEFNATVPLPSEDLETTSKFSRYYGRTFSRLTVKDAGLTKALNRYLSWLDPPTRLFSPWIVRRITWAWFKQLLGYDIL